MAVTIRGHVGEVRWIYHTAATVQAWMVVKDAGVWTLTATLVTSDPFRLSQRPLTFVATHAKGTWRWPIVSYDWGPSDVTATLGPPEH